jgi:hypothetical protein
MRIGHQHFILGADGEPEPADMETWARWFEEASRSGGRIVARTEVGDHVGWASCYANGLPSAHPHRAAQRRRRPRVAVDKTHDHPGEQQ